MLEGGVVNHHFLLLILFLFFFLWHFLNRIWFFLFRLVQAFIFFYEWFRDVGAFFWLDDSIFVLYLIIKKQLRNKILRWLLLINKSLFRIFGFFSQFFLVKYLQKFRMDLHHHFLLHNLIHIFIFIRFLLWINIFINLIKHSFFAGKACLFSSINFV